MLSDLWKEVKKMTKNNCAHATSKDLFTATIESIFRIECVKEYRFDAKRKWRIDYAIPKHKIAIEVEGGVWTNGRHTRASGFLRDIEKYNAMAVSGWILIRVTPEGKLKKSTIDIIQQAINYRDDSSNKNTAQGR